MNYYLIQNNANNIKRHNVQSLTDFIYKLGAKNETNSSHLHLFDLMCPQFNGNTCSSSSTKYIIKFIYRNIISTLNSISNIKI